jgi:hypothetical protein
VGERRVFTCFSSCIDYRYDIPSLHRLPWWTIHVAQLYVESAVHELRKCVVYTA